MSMGTLEARANEVKPGALLIGKRVARLRKEQRLTQAQLAEKVGYKEHTAISMIEAGKSYPVWEKAERLAEVLGVTVPQLLEVKDDDLPWLSSHQLKRLFELRSRDNGRFLADLEELVSFMRELPQPAS